MSSVDAKLEARLLAGRYAGGAMPVTVEKQFSVGYDFANDILLRTASVKGIRVQVTIAEEVAHLLVVDGTVEVLGHALTAGATMMVPHYTPIKLGDECIAFGYADSHAWERTTALLRVPGPVVPDDPSLAVTETRAPLLSRILAQLPGRNPILARPVLIGALGLCFLAAISIKDTDFGLFGRGPKSADDIQVQLAALGASGLQIRSQNGIFSVSGFVDTPAQARKIAAAVAGSGQPVKLQLTTGADMAQAVSDILRVQGVNGSVVYAGNRTVNVLAAALPPGAFAKLEANAQRDVPGLRAIHFREGIGTQFSGLNGLALATANPGKRISSLVAGETGYLVTADGGRYFIGAILPTGHRIVSIEGRQVMLEQNGTAVRWIF